MHWWLWAGNSIVALDQGFCQREISQRIKEGFNQIYIMSKKILVDKYKKNRDKINKKRFNQITIIWNNFIVDKYKKNRDKLRKGFNQLYILWRNFIVDKYNKKQRQIKKTGRIQSNLHNVEEFSGATAQNSPFSSRVLCSVRDFCFLFHCW